MSNQTSGRMVRFWLDLVATLAAVSGCVLLVWLNWNTFFPPEPRLPQAPVSLEAATLRGDPAAPVVVIEYSDFMCPFCARFEAEVLPELARRHIDTGRVQWAFRHNPLERLHPGATKAAEAALCAGREGRFWEMHAALFQEPEGLDESRLIAVGRELGLDEETFGRCLRAGEVSEQVRLDIAQAEALELSGTPAFLVGRRLENGTVKVVAVVNGARPVADFEKAISRALQPESWTRAILIGGGIVVVVALWLGLSRRGPRVKNENRREVN